MLEAPYAIPYGGGGSPTCSTNGNELADPGNLVNRLIYRHGVIEKVKNLEKKIQGKNHFLESLKCSATSIQACNTIKYNNFTLQLSRKKCQKFSKILGQSKLWGHIDPAPEVKISMSKNQFYHCKVSHRQPFRHKPSSNTIFSLGSLSVVDRKKFSEHFFDPV